MRDASMPKQVFEMVGLIVLMLVSLSVISASGGEGDGAADN